MGNLPAHESLCGYHPPRCSRAPWVPSELHNKKPKVMLVRENCHETIKPISSHSRTRFTITPAGHEVESSRVTRLAAYLSPGAERSSPRWCKACHSWSGPSGSVCDLPPPPGPPPCSAGRAASTGERRDSERFGDAAATRAPAQADGVGGGAGYCDGDGG